MVVVVGKGAETQGRTPWAGGSLMSKEFPEDIYLQARELAGSLRDVVGMLRDVAY